MSKSKGPVKKQESKPDPYTTRPFNRATVERKDKIESLIRQGRSNQQIYDSIKGTGAGARKQDVLDYTRFLRDQHDISLAINRSPKKIIDVLPMGISYQSKRFKYVVIGSAKQKNMPAFDFGITVNSDVALTQEQIFTHAERLAEVNPEHYVNNPKGKAGVKSAETKTLRDASLSKLSVLQAYSKNPNGLVRIVKQQDANMKYRTKQRTKRGRKN